MALAFTPLLKRREWWAWGRRPFADGCLATITRTRMRRFVTNRHFGAHSMILRRLTACRSEEHTSELQSLMRISYAVFCLKKKKQNTNAKNDDSLQKVTKKYRQLTKKKQNTQ